MFPFGRRGVFKKKKKQFFFFFFGHAALAFGILVPRPGIEPVPPAVESQNPVTTGPPRKSLSFVYHSAWHRAGMQRVSGVKFIVCDEGPWKLKKSVTGLG